MAINGRLRQSGQTNGVVNGLLRETDKRIRTGEVINGCLQ